MLSKQKNAYQFKKKKSLRSLSSLFFNFSCELGKRLFAKFDKLAEKINILDDVKLNYVDCDADSEFCDSNGVKGKKIEKEKMMFTMNFGLFTNDRKCILMSVSFWFRSKPNSGLAVFFYPESNERVQFGGVKSEEGLSKFLIKNLGDSILVSFLLFNRNGVMNGILEFMKKENL